MYEIGTLEGALEIVLSGFSTSSNFFGVCFHYRLISNPAVKSQVSFHAMPCVCPTSGDGDDGRGAWDFSYVVSSIVLKF